MIQHLEQIEPDLVEFLLDTLTQLSQELGKCDLPAKTRRTLERQVESLCLVCITAVRKSYFTLWQQTSMGDELLRRDPSLAEAEPQDGGQPTPPPEALGDT